MQQLGEVVQETQKGKECSLTVVFSVGGFCFVFLFSIKVNGIVSARLACCYLAVT